MVSSPSASVMAALRRFAEGPDTAARTVSLTAILAERALTKVAKEVNFQTGLIGLGAAAQNAPQSSERLSAIAQLIRVAQSNRTLQSRCRDLVRPALVAKLPPVNLLKEADERFYVAKACELSEAEWVLDYAASAVAEEDTAERARAAFMAILIGRSATLAAAFGLLVEAMTVAKPQTESPAETMARRLTRILAGLRSAVVQSMVPPGERAGAQLAAIISRPTDTLGFSPNEEARVGLAVEAALTVHDLVRTRFSVSTDSESYQLIRVCRRQFPGGSWPAQMQGALERVSADILEAILLLGKQGMVERSFRDHLELTAGNTRRAEVLMKQLADEHPELPEQVRAWLRKEQSPRSKSTPDTLQESRELGNDPVVADLILDAQRLNEMKGQVERLALPGIELFDPEHSSRVKQLLKRVETVSMSLEELAKRRRLAIYGGVGEEMDSAPKYFDVVGGASGKRIKIVRPAVVRLADDGTPGEVVRKGLAE